jgi:paraquat-inducible protein B
VRIGEVVNFSLIGDKNSANFKIPVLIKVEPERFTITKDGKAEKRDEKMDIALLKRLIKKGLRAQLQTMSLLTGDLFVNLDFHKNVKSAKLLKEHGIYVIPTVPATIETLKSDIQTLLDRLASIPLEEIGKEFKKSIKLANDEMIPALSKVAEDTSDLIRESNNTIKEIKKETLPKLNDALESLDKSLKEAKRSYLNRNSQFNGKLLRLLDEVRQATKSIKSLMNYLQRHPDSILKGK